MPLAGTNNNNYGSEDKGVSIIPFIVGITNFHAFINIWDFSRVKLKLKLSFKEIVYIVFYVILGIRK
jgi:hypothetical protein